MAFLLFSLMVFEAYPTFLHALAFLFPPFWFAFDLACIHHSGVVRYHYSSRLLLLIIYVLLLFVMHVEACHVMLILSIHMFADIQSYGCCKGLPNDIRCCEGLPNDIRCMSRKRYTMYECLGTEYLCTHLWLQCPFFAYNTHTA
jgi:hypothetical protein